MSNQFQRCLSEGKIGESIIAKWFQGRGFNILPVYEKEIQEGKGPTLFTSSGENVICPDLLVFNKEKIYWIEAKHKTAFSWHRKTMKWVTGIDIRHYKHYLKISENISNWPVYLLFLHKDGSAKDTPQGMISPSGLYGGEIGYLSRNENHRSDKWGKSGMVYWSDDKLTKYSSLPNLFI